MNNIETTPNILIIREFLGFRTFDRWVKKSETSGIPLNTATPPMITEQKKAISKTKRKRTSPHPNFLSLGIFALPTVYGNAKIETSSFGQKLSLDSDSLIKSLNFPQTKTMRKNRVTLDKAIRKYFFCVKKNSFGPAKTFPLPSKSAA